MLSATDPVATLSVLSSLGAIKDPHLFNLIFGESVLNDAVAIVLYTVFDRAAQRAGAEGNDTAAWLAVRIWLALMCSHARAECMRYLCRFCVQQDSFSM